MKRQNPVNHRPHHRRIWKSGTNNASRPAIVQRPPKRPPRFAQILLFVILGLLSISEFFSVGCGRRSPGAADETQRSFEGDDTTAVAPSTGSSPDASNDASDVRRWESVVDLPRPLALFDTVFWEPRDTISLRQLIRDAPLVKDKTVLEIGTGSGLLSLCCLQAGARKVVATDINPAAVENARFNARQLRLDGRFEARLVPMDNPSAYSVVGTAERFDLIISNPPWENDTPQTIDQYALYDPGFGLLDSLLKDLKDHLMPGGKALLAYGCVTAIKTIQRFADQYGLVVKVLDERDLDRLPEVFLPGMLLEVSQEI